MADPNFYIETPRLVLTQFQPSCDAHCQFLLELFNSLAYLQNCNDWKVRTFEQARTFIETTTVKAYEEQGFGAYIVALKSQPNTPLTGAPSCEDNLTYVGNVGIFQRKSLSAPDLGYSFLPQFEGKGYATEAARAVLQYAREVLGKKDMIALTTEDNKASQRIMEKLGLVRWKTLAVPEWETPTLIYLPPGMTEITLTPPPAPERPVHQVPQIISAE